MSDYYTEINDHFTNPYSRPAQYHWTLSEAAKQWLVAREEEQMAMTRVDYRNIAAALNQARLKLDTAMPSTRAEVIDLVAVELADVLAKTNPNFKRDVFLAATKQQEKGQ